MKAKVAPTRRERQLARRAHRAARVLPVASVPTPASEAIIHARLAEARANLGHAIRRASAAQEQVLRLERAVARRTTS